MKENKEKDKKTEVKEKRKRAETGNGKKIEERSDNGLQEKRLQSIVVKIPLKTAADYLRPPARPRSYPTGYDDDLKLEEEIFSALKRAKPRNLGPPADKDPFKGFSGPDDPLLIPDYTVAGPSKSPSQTSSQKSKDDRNSVLEDLTTPNDIAEQPQPMDVDKEADATKRSPFKRPEHTQDPPELVNLRKFLAEFPDPMGKDPASWARWEYLVATHKHPGIYGKILAAAVQEDQAHDREEQAAQEENIWQMYYEEIQEGKNPKYSACEGMFYSTRKKLQKRLNSIHSITYLVG